MNPDRVMTVWVGMTDGIIQLVEMSCEIASRCSNFLLPCGAGNLLELGASGSYLMAHYLFPF